MIQTCQDDHEAAVLDQEYVRLLGYPAQINLDTRVRDLMGATRQRYRRIGHPWTYTQQFSIDCVETDSIRLSNGISLASTLLAGRIQAARAHALVIVAASAGGQIVKEIGRLWDAERPDEAYFLDAFASAVVERLILNLGVRLCETGEPDGVAALPHYSPGYPGWDLRDQAVLLQALQQSGPTELPEPLEVLWSGMLKPTKSMLAVFGLTQYPELLQRRADLCPCVDCSLASCAYRRMPMGSQGAIRKQLFTQSVVEPSSMSSGNQERGLSSSSYAFSGKALRRWADHCLKIEHLDHGRVVTCFRYEGSTCSNMGLPLAFDFVVNLVSTPDGFIIEETLCKPSKGEEGYQSMCTYIEDPPLLMKEIDEFRPLVGQPLDAVLQWNPAITMSGCLCSRGDQAHKWRVALQTIHFRLVSYDQESS